MNRFKRCCWIFPKRYYATPKRMRSPFEVLSIKESATHSEIKQKYKELAKQLHPDKKETGDLGRFQELVQAYELLMDPNKKAYYLRTGQQQQSWDVAAASSNRSPPGKRPPSYTNAYWTSNVTPRYTSNTTFISLLAGVIITISTFNLFYFHSSHTAFLSAADRHHLKSSEDLKRARAEAQLFGNDRGIKRVIDSRMDLFRNQEE